MNEQQQMRRLSAKRTAEARRLRRILCAFVGFTGLVVLGAAAISIFGHKNSDLIAAVATVLPESHLDEAPIQSGKLIEADLVDAAQVFSPNDSLILAATRRDVQAIAAEYDRLSTKGATNAEINDLERRVEQTEVRFREWLDRINRRADQPGYSLPARRTAATQTLVQQGFSRREAEAAVQAMIDAEMLPDPPQIVPAFDMTPDPFAKLILEPTGDSYPSPSGTITRSDVRRSPFAERR